MEPFGIGMAGLGAAGVATFGAFGLAFRLRRKRLATSPEASPAAVAAASGAPAKSTPRSTGERLEALAAQQAALGQRLEALAAQVASGAAEERLQAMAGQLLGLIRDKNATLETTLAGLDQLRARMRALEEMGEPAEARALLGRLGERLAVLETAQGAAAAATEARLAALDGSGATAADFARAVADLGERLARLQEARDAGLEAALARIAPLETRLGVLDGGRAEGREALQRVESRIEALSGEVTATRSEVRTELRAELLALKAEVEARVEAAAVPLADGIARLHDRKDAGLEAVLARLGTIEREVATRDPEARIDARVEGRLAALDVRLTAFGDRLARAEERSADQTPLAALAERLAALQADRDATAETVIARLGPVESRLAAHEAALAAADPQGALDRFAERLEAVSARMTALEGTGKSATEVSERLADLYRQKDAAIEALVGRLAPLEARLAALDPQGALDRFAERLEGVAARVSLIEGAEDPIAEIAGRLAELHAQKDVAATALVERLAPLEARLAALDPQGALDRFAERLEGVAARVSLIEGADDPIAEIAGRLAELHAQKDVAVVALVERLAPLEVRIAEVEGGVARVLPLAEEDPRAALAALKARLEALDHAQEAVAVGLEALRAGLARAAEEEANAQGLAEGRAAGAAEGTAAALAEVVDGMTRLFAQKDAGLAALLGCLGPLEARFAPLEERLAAVESQPRDPAVAEAVDEAAGAAAEAEAARAEARAVAEGLALVQAAAEASAERAALFADRISELEASLPRLSAAEARAMAAAEPGSGQEGVAAASDPVPLIEGPMFEAPVIEALRDLPRVVSLHQK